VILELEQITSKENPDEKFFTERLDRVNRYFNHLENSFDIMVKGMERDQFLKFRMSLLPASGFQSAQYRVIEFYATDVVNLVAEKDRQHISDPKSIDQVVDRLYWRSGATELATGKKTLTLQQFEKKYLNEFRELSLSLANRNLYQLYKKHFEGNQNIIDRLRQFDTLANVLWPLAHMKSAAHYLEKDPEDIKATGGTNWQKYLPPRFQRIIFFPELWSEQDKAEWGKAAFIRK
jgi:tryptophan 2,3-dioxygenase